MKYFTPELYLRFNSGDDAEAARAFEDWEVATAAYRAETEPLREKMPNAVRELSEMCLHDAAVLASGVEVGPVFPWPFRFAEFVDGYGRRLPRTVADGAVAWIALEQGGAVVTLLYFLADKLRRNPPPPDWPFSPERVFWMYDELAPVYFEGRGGDGVVGNFRHRILFSDGSAAEIPFSAALVFRAPAGPANGSPFGGGRHGHPAGDERRRGGPAPAH